MRTFKTTACFLAAFLLVAATPAQAWWGWLDDLSGPGKFSGPQFEFRLFCFGEESEAKKLIDAFKNVRLLTKKVNGGNQDSVKAADDAWRHLIAELNATRSTLPVIDKEVVNTASKKLAASWQPVHERLMKSVESVLTIDDDAMKQLIDDADDAARPLIARVTRGVTSIASTGVFLSACSIDKKRRSSIEVGMNLWHTDGTKDFAHGQEIKLTTLMTLFSFRVFPDPRFDFVDVGVGGGVYWFTSTGFDTFSGVILQPGRLDFHAPTVWATYPFKDVKKGTTEVGWSTSNVLRRIAAAPTFRFDLMFFPAGFEADAFAGVGDKHVPIPGDRVKSWSLFINLAPFVPMAPFKDTPPTPIRPTGR